MLSHCCTPSRGVPFASHFRIRKRRLFDIQTGLFGTPLCFLFRSTNQGVSYFTIRKIICIVILFKCHRGPKVPFLPPHHLPAKYLIAEPIIPKITYNGIELLGICDGWHPMDQNMNHTSQISNITDGVERCDRNVRRLAHPVNPCTNQGYKA